MQAIFFKKGYVKVKIRFEGTFRTMCCNSAKSWESVWDDLKNHMTKIGVGLEVEEEFKDREFKVMKVTLFPR